jgi:hypothetical protein
MHVQTKLVPIMNEHFVREALRAGADLVQPGELFGSELELKRIEVRAELVA